MWIYIRKRQERGNMINMRFWICLCCFHDSSIPRLLVIPDSGKTDLDHTDIVPCHEYILIDILYYINCISVVSFSKSNLTNALLYLWKQLFLSHSLPT